MLMPAIRAIDYPCRCLWRGFEQITSTAPWRRMILHFSHMGLTEARTFMAPQSIRYSRRQARGAQESAPRQYDPRNIAGDVQPKSWRVDAKNASGGAQFLGHMPGREDPRTVGRN